MLRTSTTATLVLLIMLSGCSLAPAPESTDTPAPSPTPTAAPTATDDGPGLSVTIPTSEGDTTRGRLYGESSRVVVFSNMSPNSSSEWEPVALELAERGYMALTYKYSRSGDARVDDLRDALAYIRDLGATEIVLIGASRGGLCTVLVALDAEAAADVVGIVSISAPWPAEGPAFYTDEELATISVPKLVIHSESDPYVTEKQRLYEAFTEPKELAIYPGSDHGTVIFRNDNADDLTQRLVDFVEASFAD